MSQCKSVVLETFTFFDEIQVKSTSHYSDPKGYNTTALRNIVRTEHPA